MSDTKKTITISPELFETTKRKQKNKTAKVPKMPKTPKVPQVKPETQLKHMRKKFLAKLKSENASAKSTVNHSEQLQQKTQPSSMSEFSSSLQYLTEYSDRLKKQKKIDSGTLKIKPTKLDSNPNDAIANNVNNQLLPLSTPLIQVDDKPVADSAETTSIQPSMQTPAQIMQTPMPMPINYTSQDLPWGALKNGSKPTYRTWKNKTQKLHPKQTDNSESVSSAAISPDKVHTLTSNNEVCSNELPSDEMHNNSSLIVLNSKPIEQKKKQTTVLATSKKTCTTITRKHKVGRLKNGTKISVLLKNKTLCNKLHLAKRALKQVPIVDVKLYLKRHNLIKVGGHAPTNILRNMYETALLSGDIYNKSADILLHNFTET